VYNWLKLAEQGKYDDVVFHRLIPGFMARLSNWFHLMQKLILKVFFRFKVATQQALDEVAPAIGAVISVTNTT
jgi:hypothetical protein